VTASTAGFAAGSGQAFDNGTGWYGLTAQLPTTTTVTPYNTNAISTGVSASVPMTWAAGDTIQLTGFYQAA
jgi:hypothetical protein